MMRPKHTKPDANQAEIVADLRKLGYDVDIVCDLPGLYDLVVSGQFKKVKLHFHTKTRGQIWIHPSVSVRVEIKSEKGELNETEQQYYENQKHKGSYLVARCTEDVLDWFGRE